MRILDSKSESIEEILEEVPSIIDILDKDSRDHFNGFMEVLSEAEVATGVGNGGAHVTIFQLSLRFPRWEFQTAI